MQTRVRIGLAALALLAACGGDGPEYVGPELYSNVRANQDRGGAPQNETSIAAQGVGSDTLLVAGWNDYRRGDVGVGFGISHDGGATWTDGIVPEPDRSAQGDPAVALGPDGTAYMAMISFERTNDGGGIYVSRSLDGRTFERAVAVQADPNLFEDKEYIAVDRSGSERSGHVYVTWTNFDFFRGTTQIVLSRSTDRGLTWSAASPVSELVPFFRGGVQGSVPAVGSFGELYVAYHESLGGRAPEVMAARHRWRPKGPPPPEPFPMLARVLGPPKLGARLRPLTAPLRSSAAGDAIVLVRSGDGGRTFEPPTHVADVPFLPPFEFRANSFPSVAVPLRGPGSSRFGTVYVAWAAGHQDGVDADIFVARSRDFGKSFSAPVRVNDDPAGAEQVFPWIAVDESGTLHAIWYDRRDDPALLRLYYAKSEDGGRSFSDNRAVTPQGFDPFTDFGGTFIGDYNGLAAAGNTAYALWTDTRAGGQDVFYAPLR